MMAKWTCMIGLTLACRSAEPVPGVTKPFPTLATSGPTAAPAEPAAPDDILAKAKAREAFPACVADIASELKLEGLTQTELASRFGAPVTRESFRAEERQGEFYVGIEDVYPSTDPRNRDVPLQEWTWKAGDCTLTVWFHQQAGVWRALDDVYWHKNVEF